jgi:hypothetical protein
MSSKEEEVEEIKGEEKKGKRRFNVTLTLNTHTLERLRKAGTKRMSTEVEKALWFYWNHIDRTGTMDISKIKEVRLKYYAYKKDNVLTARLAFELWHELETQTPADVKNTDEYKNLKQELENYILNGSNNNSSSGGSDSKNKSKAIESCSICNHAKNALITPKECSCECHIRR